ncbi:MAG: PQQ-like beta-propeller repeat protein [Bryobacterales bacterium]|nr:PQQ-like beta-propeller repeat protein [Bryobacterales bacterium]
MKPRLLLLLTIAVFAPSALAEDWPEWRGKGRHGIWTEDGILDRFPSTGLKPLWRTPVRAGYTGPSVANGRLYLTDFQPTAGRTGIERILCLDQRTGKVLWTREWPADYKGLSYPLGPRATPTVDGDRVYAVGATGLLFCLRTSNGEILWQKDYRQDYGLQLPGWGMASAPLIDGDRLIALVGGRPNAKMMAFDKRTGKELWRALDHEAEPGYGQPILTTANGIRQVLIWHATALAALQPETGRVLWQQPFKVTYGMTLATPVTTGNRILVSAFYNGSLLVQNDGDKAAQLWKGNSDNEINTDGLHAVVNTPVIDGDYIYGICSYGQFRCLRLSTGERVWETLDVTKEKARWASGFIVRHKDRYFINNDRGDLIIARLSPEGYKEISRTPLIKPTSNSGNRRELGAVNWSHPAYANRNIYARNDEEIIAYSLRK